MKPRTGTSYTWKPAHLYGTATSSRCLLFYQPESKTVCFLPVKMLQYKIWWSKDTKLLPGLPSELWAAWLEGEFGV